MIKRYLVDWVFCEECETGEYVRYKDHTAEAARLEQELENLQNKHDALSDSLERTQALWRMDSNAMEGISAERDAALAEVAKMRPVVEAAVKWLSDLTEYAELELERVARDYRDKEVTDEQNKD